MAAVQALCKGVFLTMLMGALIVPSAFGHGNSSSPDYGLLRDGTRMPPPAMPDQGSFVNFETAHVNPIALSPDGSTLVVCNTPDSHLEVYAVDGAGVLTHTVSILVGYDPVSVRFRSNTEVWVVNHVSDSINVVDLTTEQIIGTINTEDEPADVVFYTDAGNSANLAAVSCSRPDLIQVYNADTLAFVDQIEVLGQDPRSLVTDGTNVYAAIFKSGNGTTIIGSAFVTGFTALTNGGNPYGGTASNGQFFNNGIPGTGWMTPSGLRTPADLATDGVPTPPPVSLIVRKDFSDSNRWKDDNGADWTDFITGANATTTTRVTGWDLLDHDIFSFSTTNGTSSANAGFGTNGYVGFGTTINADGRRINIAMAMGINPANNSLMMVGTDATNEIRFEPNLEGTFTRVMAGVASSTGIETAFVDINEAHLDAAQGGVGLAYQDGHVPQADRNLSIGNPRSVAFNPTGTRAYVTGKGSGNIVVLDPATGLRLGGISHTIDLGANLSSPTTGPSGAVHHGSLNLLYVVNRFSSSVMVIDTSTLGSETNVQTEAFFDPTPQFIQDGRVQFYDTHRTSGLGQISCASCHIDGQTDQLAWDLGNPDGAVKNTNPVNIAMPGPGQHNMFLNGFTTAFANFHPMKGPMTTQTLIDIIGKEPLHWRGDQDGIEGFAGAFSGLQGRDFDLEPPLMQEFENFLSSLHFMPNPFRALDNSLAGGPNYFSGTNPLLPMTGFHSNGRFSPRGTTLPDGNAWRGFQLYVQGNPAHGAPPLDSIFQCVTCHTLPTGAGSIDFALFDGPNTEFDFVDIPPGPMGEAHMALVSVDGTGEAVMKTAQLRNQLDKQGYNMKPNPLDGGNPHVSTAGFGILHDGALDNIDSFLSSLVFDLDDDQDLSDIMAFTLSVSGGGYSDLITLTGAPTFSSPSGLPIGQGVTQLGPDGGTSQSAHAGVGKQSTITTSTATPLITAAIALAEDSKIDLIVSAVKDGVNRNWYLIPSGGGRSSDNTFQSDNNPEQATLAEILALASVSTPVTFMAVPEGSGLRMGVDRDEDGTFNFSEANGMGMSVASPKNNGLLIVLLTIAAAVVLVAGGRFRKTS